MKAARPGLFVHLSIVLVSSSLIAGCAGLSSRTSSATSPSPGATPSPVPTPTGDAKFIYSIVNAEVAGFTVQPDGKLQAIPRLASPQQLNSTQLVVSPDAMWLFTITSCAPDPDRCWNQGGAVFNQSIHSDGKLDAPTMVIPADQKTIALAVDQTSHFVYALSELDFVPPFEPSTGCSGTLQVLTAYAIGTDGGLVPLNSKVTTDNSGYCPDTSTSPENTLIGFHQDTTSNFLWLTKSVTGRNVDTVSLISIPIAADGTLGALTETLVGGMMTKPANSVIAGQFLVNSEDDEFEGVTVATFRLQNGGFQFASQCSTDVPACNVFTIAASPSGKVVYAISGDFASGLTVNALTLDATTGELVPFGKSIALPQGAIFDEWPVFPVLATVDLEGSFLFISRNGDATITTIALDPITGELGTSADFAVGAPPKVIVSVTK